MPNTPPSKVGESSKPVKKTQSSSKRTSIESSKDSDRYEPPVVSSAEEMNTEGKRWYELLQEKIGFDGVAKEWMTNHPELVDENKSEVLIRLACEVCLAKNTKYDPENENEEQKNKYIRFDTQRIFEIFKVANPLIEKSDRKNFVEFVCQKGNVQLLEMICKEEGKNKGHFELNKQYTWKGDFSGYSRLIDLLQYVIDNRCSPEIVLCLAEKTYGYTHILWNGKQYLSSFQAQLMEGRFNYQNSVVKELLKQVIKLGYKDAISVMLSGDIYHCIRLMKLETFQKKEEFVQAYDAIKKTIADVINSWKESCQDDVRRLLDQGIEIDIDQMKKQDLILQIKEQEIDIPNIAKKTLDQLKEVLGKEVGQKNVKTKLRSTIVGALIATLFFNYRDQVLEGRSFTIKISYQDSSRKKEKIDQLNSNTEDTVLELINVLNSSSHISNNWFFREVLVKVVNENLDKLKAVCAAICKEPMEELLKSEEIHEDVRGVLQSFGVEVLTNQIVRSEIPSSCSSIADQFMKDINVYYEKEAKEDCSSNELAFSGLTRKIICDLEEKKGLADEEKKALISKALSQIKKGINILADKTAVKIDVKDIFLSFELINSKITKEERREIVEFICQKGNVQLLEMICKEEGKNKGHFELNKQYTWKGDFSGYSRLIDLLQYVIDNRCSPEIVLCLAEKTYGYTHILYNGEQYFSKRKIADLKKRFNYQDSDIKDLLKQAVKLGYKDAVSVMLSGDIYHCIRLMKLETFQKKEEFVQAYDAIKKTIADVINSWKESCQDDVRRLLDQGIEIDIDQMKKQDLILQIKEQEIDIPNIAKKTLDQLKEVLGKEVGQKNVKTKLRSTIVGALIATLFFNYRDQVLEGRSFTIKISYQDSSRKKEKIDQLNSNTEDTVLELINVLNSSSHISNNWFFREVLVKVVNENLDKLKAVCAAICKEPMEELLKSEEIHENVTHVLQFFGVEKDFLLLRKNTTNVAVSVSVKSIDESLSDTSEKSVSSSSQQSLADGRPENSSALQTRGSKSLPHPSTESRETQEQLGIRKSVPTLKSQKSHFASSSKLTEKNNEGAVQKKCGQSEKVYYSRRCGGLDSSLSGVNIYSRDKMEKFQQGGVVGKILSKKDALPQKKPRDSRLPRISHLDDAHSERYKKVFLNKLFSYNKFVDVSTFLNRGQNLEVGSLRLDSSLSSSSDASLVSSPNRLNDSRDQVSEDDSYLDGIKDYIEGLELLKEGDENRGRDKIRRAIINVPEPAEPAMYAYAIMKFKEVVEGNIVLKNLSGVDCGSKETVGEAVKCMINSGVSFFPLNSFVLGIMGLYNVGGYSDMIQTVSKKHWKAHFADVLRSTRGTPMMDSIADRDLLSLIESANLNFTEPREYLDMVGKEEGVKELESMVDHVKYELARDMVLNKENNITARRLFEELSFKVSSSGKFLHPDAQFSYAIALFVGRLKDTEKERKIYDLLSKADGCGHLEARLFLGILLFKKGYEFYKSSDHWSYLENYLNMIGDDKDKKQNYLKEKISSFVAYEYINDRSSYVRYNEQKARDILQRSGDEGELQRLEREIEKKRTLQPKNLLGDVRRVLKKVQIKFSQQSYDHCPVDMLLDMLRELSEKLKVSDITIPEDTRLSFELEELSNVSSIKMESILSLQVVCSIVRQQITQQLSSSAKEGVEKELLSTLKEVDSMLCSIYAKMSRSQGIDDNKESFFDSSTFFNNNPFTSTVLDPRDAVMLASSPPSYLSHRGTRGERRVFVQVRKEQEELLSGSLLNDFRNLQIADKDKSSYGSGLSLSSGFKSDFSALSGEDTSEENGAASLDSKSSKVSGGAIPKQGSVSLQRNVSKISVLSKSVGGRSQLKSASELSSRASESATSNSSTISMPKRTSTDKKEVDDSRSSSLPSSSLHNLKTEEHKSSGGRGNKK